MKLEAKHQLLKNIIRGRAASKTFLLTTCKTTDSFGVHGSSGNKSVKK